MKKRRSFFSFFQKSLFTIHRHYHLDLSSLQLPLNRIADSIEQFNYQTWNIKSEQIASQIKEEADLLHSQPSGPFAALLRDDPEEPDDGTDILYTDHDQIALDEELKRRGMVPEGEE